ncbi:DNA-binding NarL/FixJ family response regulator [Nakamurella sp. UYEF19]|uniref:response regulator transcription factor n=1 Tax=Nakamurella sp. UYEF19 TaxID=1756392 RepID=UPI0033959CC9
MTESPPEVIRVAVVDDHAFVRRGVRAYLDTVPSVEVIGEANDGEQILALLEQWRTTGQPVPHVILMDLQMPGMGGVEATEAIAQAHPDIRVVVLTSFGEVERVHAALAAGAAGYLLKDADPHDVGTAIRDAAAGRVHLDSTVARQLARRMSAPKLGLSGLTTREREILVLVAQGLSNNDIAARLVISDRTARTHVSNVLGKLQLSSRTQAALLAIREGLITPPPS